MTNLLHNFDKYFSYLLRFHVYSIGHQTLNIQITDWTVNEASSLHSPVTMHSGLLAIGVLNELKRFLAKNELNVGMSN